MPKQYSRRGESAFLKSFIKESLEKVVTVCSTGDSFKKVFLFLISGREKLQSRTVVTSAF